MLGSFGLLGQGFAQPDAVPASGGGTSGNYTAEDGVTAYVAEDGVTNYVTES